MRASQVLAFALGVVACTPGEPPGSSPRPAASEPAADSSVVADVAPASSSSAAAEAPPLADAAGAEAAPSLEPTDGTEPQTEDKPVLDDPLTQARAAALFRALVEDDPTPALPFFFPLDAYRQVKDSSNPSADWQNRLMTAYKRDLHELHRARPELARASFVRLTYNEAAARWVKPGEEYNKIGYYRVFGSKLVYAREDGSEREIPIKSLISWRGKFFVVHLSSFK